jgi:hypothetical protein
MTHHDSRIFDGQRYDWVRSDAYTRLDGTETSLLVWRSACPVCGEPFEIRTPASTSRFQPNRRCTQHKRPGIRVNPRGARKPPPLRADEHWPDIYDHISQLRDAGIIPGDAEDWA